jgi:hypothetical protein
MALHSDACFLSPHLNDLAKTKHSIRSLDPHVYVNFFSKESINMNKNTHIYLGNSRFLCLAYVGLLGFAQLEINSLRTR